MRPSGIVTLLTDFGARDPFVGVMKGVILSRAPAARLVDLTHQIQAHAVAEAAFWLERSFGYFPPGTVHLAVVDPGVGTARRALAAQAHGHLFLAPDNGLLSVLLSADPEARVVSLERAAALGLPPPSATFHGRDLFAPLAALLAVSAVALPELGPPAGPLHPSPLPPPRATAAGLAGQVVTVDHFGNLLTNLPPERARAATIRGRELPVVRTYGDAPRGALVALAGSFGTLELAQVEGRAADVLRAGAGEPVLLARDP